MSAESRRPGPRVVVVTGATGATGRATCAAVLGRGDRVVAVGRDAESLERLTSSLGDGLLETRVCDLLDGAAVQALGSDVVTAHGGVDALFHLVGGWRGSDSFTASTDDDWQWLSGNLVDTLRHTTLALHDPLLASGRGRVAIVSAAAAGAPTAGNAAYAAAKAAAETWLLALADSFATAAATPGSAASVGVVRWIGKGAAATTPEQVAEWLAGLLDADPAALNGARVELWSQA
jgi:3-oxoacyl-[acyl-carrier protein] reductase